MADLKEKLYVAIVDVANGGYSMLNPDDVTYNAFRNDLEAYWASVNKPEN